MKYFFLAIAILFLSSPVFSQNERMFNYSYEISVPVGETQDFIGRASWLGFSMSGHRFIKTNILVGGSFSWHVLHQKKELTQEFSREIDGIPVNGAINGTQFRYINSFPLHVTGHYVAGDEASKIRPYAGLGLGMSVINQRTEIGIFALDDTRVHFSFTPEAGIFIPAGEVTLFKAGVKFPYAIAGSDSINISYLTFSLGFANTF